MQPGAKGATLEMTDTPDVVVVHTPEVCSGWVGDLADAELMGVGRRQVTGLPEVRPTLTEHRSERRRCGCCGTTTAGAFPGWVRAPVSYRPRIRTVVVYLLARQHIPVARAAEAARDLFGVRLSTGTVDAIYAEAGRRLTRFITALVAMLRCLPVIHADETTDWVGTTNIWMHVVSTARYTLVHASPTRGWEAVREAGVLIGYRGVVIHDRLALYWKLRTARHGICSAHLLRDLTAVAEQTAQRQWASGLAGLLVADQRRLRRGPRLWAQSAGPEPAASVRRPLRHPGRQGLGPQPDTPAACQDQR